MCEFVSWIEHRDQILFLTDAEVFSPHGKEVLQGSRGIDFLGHGAIRAFYGIGAWQSVGVEHEERRFWMTELYPEPIRKKLEEGFDVNWGKMFAFFSVSDLLWIIENHPDPDWKSKAFRELKKRDLDADDFFGIICDPIVPDNLRQEAFKELKKRDPEEIHYFLDIICCPSVPDDLKKKAFKEFKKCVVDALDATDFLRVIRDQFVPDDLRWAAFRELKKFKPMAYEFLEIIHERFVPENLKRNAFKELKKLKKPDLDKKDIFDIIEDDDVPESLREEAKKLLQVKPR